MLRQEISHNRSLATRTTFIAVIRVRNDVLTAMASMRMTNEHLIKRIESNDRFRPHGVKPNLNGEGLKQLRSEQSCRISRDDASLMHIEEVRRGRGNKND